MLAITRKASVQFGQPFQFRVVRVHDFREVESSLVVAGFGSVLVSATPS
ncbi:hypothetical protein [Actinoplanes siamensis]|nr:hypothetical protein [Actinoplanes siamensis]